MTDTELKLPDELPKRWVEQISTAARDSWLKGALTIVLGSSVVATLISVVPNFYSERSKARIEIEKENAAETRQLLRKLSDDLTHMVADLDDLQATGAAIHEAGASKTRTAYLAQLVDTTTTQMAIVTGDLTDSRVDTLLAKRVRGVMNPLSLQVIAVTDARNSEPFIQAYQSSYRPDLNAIQVRIEEIIRQTTIPLVS